MKMPGKTQIQTCIMILVLVYLICPSGQLFADDAITKTITTMTLEQKVGQLLMVGFHGKTLSNKDAAFLRKIKPGGIIFYGRNFGSASDLPPVISGIKKAVKDQKVPLFFAVDQEGGIVHRIGGEYYKPPSAPAIGAANSEDIAEKAGVVTGETLRSLGININLAPVLDVPADIRHSTMTLRSYSNNPEVVERLGVAYMKGLRSAGILATAKHFPGIGRASGDTHEKLSYVFWHTEQEKENDILPFKGAIEAGVDILMAGHVIAEPGDGKRPVSLSSYWLRDVLRKNLGFKGLVLIDNIEMKPIQEMMDLGKAAVEAFNAGADIIMVSHEHKNQEAAYQALLDGVKTGIISIARLDESLLRILQVKTFIRNTHVYGKQSDDFRSVTRAVGESSAIALRLKDAKPYDFARKESVLYIGFDPNLFDALKPLFKDVEMMNSSVSNYQAIHPRNPFSQFFSKFDMVVLDSHYSDIEEVIALCNNLGKQYIVFQHRVNSLENTLQTIKPGAVLVMLDHTKTSYRIAAELLKGSRKTKGVLPFQTPSAAFYVLF